MSIIYIVDDVAGVIETLKKYGMSPEVFEVKVQKITTKSGASWYEVILT